MQPNKAYDEVIEFIASSSPQNVIAFRPSEEAKARVADLIFREKTEGLPEDEGAGPSLSGKWLDGLVPNSVRQSLTAQIFCANMPDRRGRYFLRLRNRSHHQPKARRFFGDRQSRLRLCSLQPGEGKRRWFNFSV